jgi:hypothetical protein
VIVLLARWSAVLRRLYMNVVIYEGREPLVAASGTPIEVVSKRLGHSGISVSAEPYMHAYKDRDANAAVAFEKLLR